MPAMLYENYVWFLVENEVETLSREINSEVEYTLKTGEVKVLIWILGLMKQ